jgi:hypothetical protein
MNIWILMNPSASGLTYVRCNGFWCSRNSSVFLPFSLKYDRQSSTGSTFCNASSSCDAKPRCGKHPCDVEHY